MVFGYARASSTDQSTAIQEDAHLRAGCDTVRAETGSGRTRDGRTELRTLLVFMRRDDALMVTRSTGWPGPSVTCRTSSASCGPKAWL